MADVIRRRFLLVPFALLLAGCDLSLGHLAGRASDEKIRRYPLSAGGEIAIVNTNGKIEVEGTDASEVEVKIERIARAATDEGARELLPRIAIKEDVSPERIWLETERMRGLMIGARFEVRYHVRAPRGTLVNVTNTNGQVAVTGIAGNVVARTTNGGVTARGLTGGVEARTTNGAVRIDVASVGKAPISAHTTNGLVVLGLPEDARADVSASWTNGGVNVAPELKLEVTERSRRRFEGRMNGGGTPIELATTNGGIRLGPRTMAEAAEKNTDDTEDTKATTVPKDRPRLHDRRDPLR